jgi:hypothetical protein
MNEANLDFEHAESFGDVQQAKREVHYAKKQMKVLMNNNCEL